MFTVLFRVTPIAMPQGLDRSAHRIGVNAAAGHGKAGAPPGAAG